jgi:hypothetical protein
VADQLFVAGSYRSAPETSPAPSKPLTASTRPSRSLVELCAPRPSVMLPVGENVLVAGSYSSAEASRTPPLPVPPETSTLPESRAVRVGKLRVVDMGPVAVQAPVTGS